MGVRPESIVCTKEHVVLVVQLVPLFHTMPHYPASLQVREGFAGRAEQDEQGAAGDAVPARAAISARDYAHSEDCREGGHQLGCGLGGLVRPVERLPITVYEGVQTPVSALAV